MTNTETFGVSLPASETYDAGADLAKLRQAALYYQESYPPYLTPVNPATGATAGAPGAFTPAGCTPPLNVANLIAGIPRKITASPATNWTTGQYVQTATAGAPGQAYWNGTTWVAGVHALAADAEGDAPDVEPGTPKKRARPPKKPDG